MYFYNLNNICYFKIEETEAKPKRPTPAHLEDSEQKENKKEKKVKRKGKEEKIKYKGYEELLDIEDEVLDDEELPNPNGCYC